MNEKDLIRMRQKAEQAVADMKDGELKIAAFRTILEKLLATSDLQPSVALTKERGKTATPPATEANSLPGRILAIKAEGFFKSQRTLAEVKAALATRGWHYPVTSLSGAMQGLTRRREFRREQTSNENKKVWKYCNP